MVLGGEGLWEVIKSWELALMNGISAFIILTLQNSLSLYNIWGHMKKNTVFITGTSLTRQWICWDPDLRLLHLQKSNKKILSYLVYGIIIIIASGTV